MALFSVGSLPGFKGFFQHCTALANDIIIILKQEEEFLFYASYYSM